ncbi:hypothetical protein Lesp02_28260 [Lentzea sp. NBRC 105346]|uniref:helix-turn-helix domain-containing protein n=1 Tax=Lentzea sp. NBRC 105346 TaxID=3032205 RepID=UPI0025520F86|nr:helix-turn-helix transcriptional regulator [Lentzea sp. NBRC 105346]GLZ30637.1 hypothetical protein Lesp02_28260 [Lentzea sp. NBRC 105346]
MKESNKEQSGLGVSIRQAREAADLSLRQLAALAGLNYSYLAKIEMGQSEHPSADRLQRIAEVLKIDPADLLGFIGVTPPKGLPSVAPYLRQKHGLKGDALAEATEQIQKIIEKYNTAPPDK